MAFWVDLRFVLVCVCLNICGAAAIAESCEPMVLQDSLIKDRNFQIEILKGQKLLVVGEAMGNETDQLKAAQFFTPGSGTAKDLKDNVQAFLQSHQKEIQQVHTDANFIEAYLTAHEEGLNIVMASPAAEAQDWERLNASLIFKRASLEPVVGDIPWAELQAFVQGPAYELRLRKPTLFQRIALLGAKDASFVDYATSFMTEDESENKSWLETFVEKMTFTQAALPPLLATNIIVFVKASSLADIKSRLVENCLMIRNRQLFSEPQSAVTFQVPEALSLKGIPSEPKDKSKKTEIFRRPPPTRLGLRAARVFPVRRSPPAARAQYRGGYPHFTDENASKAYARSHCLFAYDYYTPDGEWHRRSVYYSHHRCH